jgi:NIMA (never in mitosis gene a)-related kinase
MSTPPQPAFSDAAAADIITRYRRVHVIGSGAFGTVWLVKSARSGRSYVMKELSVGDSDSHEYTQAMKEISILRHLVHPFIIRYRGAYVHDGIARIYMEYASNGDLHKAITRQHGVPFEETTVLTWFVQLVLAVEFLHARHILHRDIKTQNVFLTEQNTVKLGDFGISRLLNSTAELAHTLVGSPYYLSPEMCQSLPCMLNCLFTS